VPFALGFPVLLRRETRLGDEVEALRQRVEDRG